MELGCFLAGALLSSQGQICTTEVMGCIEPIRDFLAIIFFASIGFHVFPTFVLYELTILVVLTLSLVIMKFLMAVLVLSAILPKGSRHIRWIVSAGLAQVSEFSFVLGSRARRAGIISREVYLLVLSVTTLSLLLAPVLWRAATHKWVPRAERKTLARPPPLLPHPAD
ncbi:transmembrane and coiled-coil domain-containing protein 3-like isoform X2 [Salvelinus namaycush]|uniref:Transmembrane and coiled-coil domain-containing protein 3-like isoform X2 n=3 Tax=Salvelinus TaxID=8033 RepID=A0A8U0QCG5_SALNM|nr:transmembrane and coiled-coil domain-containing protein 3-like isoform X2 [Salvelinus namaycush]